MPRIVGYGHPRIERVAWESPGDPLSSSAPLGADTATVRMELASLNPKDLLIASGASRVPSDITVLGIDGVGVLDDDPSRRVALIGAGLGESEQGCFSTRCAIAPEQLLIVPEHLSALEAAQFGTAGLAGVEAARRVVEARALHDELDPELPVLVTGSSGAVGRIALLTLRHAGIPCLGAVRSEQAASDLRAAGFAALVVAEDPGEPRVLATASYAAVIDTVGGPALGTYLSEVCSGGSVLCLGNGGGNLTTTSLLPFILRDVQMRGLSTDTLPVARLQEDLDLFGAVVESLRSTETEEVILTPTLNRLSLREAADVLSSGRPPSGRSLVDPQR